MKHIKATEHAYSEGNHVPSGWLFRVVSEDVTVQVITPKRSRNLLLYLNSF